MLKAFAVINSPGFRTNSGHKSWCFFSSEKRLILHRPECRFNVSGSGSSGSSGVRERSKDKPPKLPPRDNSIYGPHNIPKVGPLILTKLFSAFNNTKVAQTCWHLKLIFESKLHSGSGYYGFNDGRFFILTEIWRLKL